MKEGEFNNGKPIDIDDLDEKDIDQAFHEWAEGSAELEELFHVCYKQGIKTWASDAHTESRWRFTNRDYRIEENPDELVEEKPAPYISFVLDERSEEYMKSIYELLKDRDDVRMSMALWTLKNDDTLPTPSTFTVFPNPEVMNEIFSVLARDIEKGKPEKINSPEFEKMKQRAKIFENFSSVEKDDIKYPKVLFKVFFRLAKLIYKIQSFTSKKKTLPEPSNIEPTNIKSENDEGEKKPSWELSQEELAEFNSKANNIKDIEETRIEEHFLDDDLSK